MTTQTASGSDSMLEQAEAPSDEWLMRRYVEGAEVALSELIGRYERELYGYLRRMVSDANLAEDVFQAAFVQVHLKRKLYEFGRPFRPWLYAIATNQAIDALRRQKRHERASLDGDLSNEGSCSLLDQIAAEMDDPSCDAERNERGGLVRSVVDSLPEHLRAVIVLSYYQGMKYKEIAEVLDIPVGTVKSRLHAAIQRLGQRWTELGLTQDV